ncbi:MAG TPA: formate dehydrogenase subunit delta [Magnetospirillaceae bacterium]|nr:formate dehydrogenase subunit delta [Magnetospirillaceae bacterium]
MTGSSTEKLIKMANQIGMFFSAMPDRQQAVNDTAGHLRRSWEPRMRRAFFAYIDEHGTHGLSDILIEVVKTKRTELEPPVAS